VSIGRPRSARPDHPYSRGRRTVKALLAESQAPPWFPTRSRAANRVFEIKLYDVAPVKLENSLFPPPPRFCFCCDLNHSHCIPSDRTTFRPPNAKAACRTSRISQPKFQKEKPASTPAPSFLNDAFRVHQATPSHQRPALLVVRARITSCMTATFRPRKNREGSGPELASCGKAFQSVRPGIQMLKEKPA